MQKRHMLEITMTVMCKNKGHKLCGWIERTVEHLTMYLVILDRRYWAHTENKEISTQKRKK